MNPYTQQANQNNPYSYNQNFMSNLPPDLVNSFTNQQNNNGASNTNSPQQQPMFDPQQMANIMAKRQVYANNQMFNMPSQSSMDSSSPVMSLQSPQIQQNSMITPQQLFQIQQQQHLQQQLPQQLRNAQQQSWMNKQQQQQLALQKMDEQQKRQFLMLQQQQMKKAQQLQRQTYMNTTNKLETEELSEAKKGSFSPKEIEINSKRVEIILAMNQELIRLFIEIRNTGRQLEPDISVYQTKLQSNLTFLATMADISMVKPGEDFKIPPPPDLSPLPPPKSEIGKKIHEILNITNNLFESYPSPDTHRPVESQLQRKPSGSSSQQLSPRSLTMQQQQALQQQIVRQQLQHHQLQQMNRMNNINNSLTSTPPTSMNARAMMDPQSILRQAQQSQQAQGVQQAQQSQQAQTLMQQNMMANMGLSMSSPSNNTELINEFSPIQNNTESPSLTSIPSQQQMTPTDLLAANNMINPNSMLINPNNNLMLGSGNGIYTPENTEDYSNVMLMMQRLQ